MTPWPGTIRLWPVWKLAPGLRSYLLAVSCAGAVAIGVAARFTAWSGRDAILFGCLLGFGTVTVETIRRLGEPAGSPRDLHGIWELATAILLPPFYALIAPVIIMALNQWRIRRTVVHRRVFSAAAVGLSYGAASLAFHSAWRGSDFPTISQSRLWSWMPLAWLALAVACAVLRFALNSALIGTVIKLGDPSVRWRAVLADPDGLYNDLAELCVGVLVALSVAVSPVMLIVALPCATLLQRSASHAQLLHASRTDPKTGLLTASTWQREADIQITRATRTHTPLAAAMIDIDHFKVVNDTYGHLAGDAVLAGVAAALTGGMREYDLAGRFGGEEFCLLLPHADAEEAVRIAERLRVILSHIRIPANAVPGENPPTITVSIGVAVLTRGINDLTDLLAAADAALYRAKNSGRNAVRLADYPPPPPPSSRSPQVV